MLYNIGQEFFKSVQVEFGRKAVIDCWHYVKQIIGFQTELNPERLV